MLQVVYLSLLSEFVLTSIDFAGRTCLVEELLGWWDAYSYTPRCSLVLRSSGLCSLRWVSFRACLLSLHGSAQTLEGTSNVASLSQWSTVLEIWEGE